MAHGWIYQVIKVNVSNTACDDPGSANLRSDCFGSVKVEI